MRRFLHHVAQFAGQRQLALAVDHGGFRAQNGAADFGPGQARDQADFALFVRERVAELEHAEKFVDFFGAEGDGIVRAFFHDLARDLAADVADFALQIAYAGFARVAADDLPDRVVGELDVLVGQPGLAICFLTRNCFAISTFSGSV